MENIKLKAIVLSSTNYKDKDKIINLFSLEKGLISAILKGVRKDSAKLKMAGQPFCFGTFLMAKKNNFYVVTSVDIEETFFDLTKDYNAYNTAFSLLEVVRTSLMSEEPSSLIFVNLLKALKAICYENLEPSLVLAKFLSGMLKVLGYNFNFKACDACNMPFVNKKYLNLDTGAINCGSCVTNSCIFVSNSVFNALKMLSSTSIEKLNTIKIQDKILKETLTLLIKNYEVRIDKKLKTIKQL